MRLCVGVVAKILSLCLSKGISRKTMIEALAKAVDPDGCYDIDSTTVNRILNCSNSSKPGKNRTGNAKGRFVDVILIAKKASPKAVTNGIEDNVKGLFIADKIDLLIYLLLDVVESDTALNDKFAISFEQYSGKTKQKLLEEEEHDFSELLAGLWLFSLAVVENNIGRGCEKKNEDCDVSNAAAEAYRHRNKDGTYKDEYKQALSKAVTECGKPCVLCITDDYISSFCGTPRKQRTPTLREYSKRTNAEVADEIGIDVTRLLVLSNEQKDCCLKCHKEIEKTIENGNVTGLVCESVTAPNGTAFLLCPNCRAKTRNASDDEMNGFAEIKLEYLETDKLVNNKTQGVHCEHTCKSWRQNPSVAIAS